MYSCNDIDLHLHLIVHNKQDTDLFTFWKIFPGQKKNKGADWHYFMQNSVAM